MTKPEATTLEVAEAPARMPGTAPAANGNGGAEHVLPGEAAVARAARRSLEGRSRGLARLWPFLGPAFIAAVAYIDPGNFATNIAGGAKFGYLLLWVVLAANLIAMVVQTQSAKLGIATGKNLPEACRELSRGRTSIGLWIQAEIVAMSTDIAEVVGAALGPQPALRHPPVHRRADGRRRRLRDPWPPAAGLPPARGGDRGDGRGVVLGFAFEIFSAKPNAGEVLKHLVVPGFGGTESVLLATGIIGATVMPHVIYLHSALTQRRMVGRNDHERRQILRFEQIDVVIAMAIAGLVNVSMMAWRRPFHTTGLVEIDSIEGAFDGLSDLISATPPPSSGSPSSPPASLPLRSGRCRARW